MVVRHVSQVHASSFIVCFDGVILEKGQYIFADFTRLFRTSTYFDTV
jgi:hypothetical protein